MVLERRTSSPDVYRAQVGFVPVVHDIATISLALARAGTAFRRFEDIENIFDLELEVIEAQYAAYKWPWPFSSLNK